MPDSKRALGARAVLAVAVIGLAGAPAAQAAKQGRKPIAAAGPQVTRDASDQGAAPQAAAQRLRVYLAPRGGEDALKAAVAAVSTPGSPTYGQYLTPRQFHARFQPTADTVAAVKAWLKSAGLKVTGAEPNGRYLTVSGDAAAAEAAFATSLHEFTHAGETFQAPTKTATVPDSVAGAIVAVSGLETRTQTMRHDAQFPPPDAFVNARPCSNSYGQVPASFQADFKTPLPKFQGKTLPYAVCGYQPAQLRAAYEAGSKLTGAGQTVGVVDAYAAPTILADANQYATRHGDPAFAGGQFSESDANKFTHANLCDPSGWFGEETLDVEAVHAMAPAAAVRYYGAASCENSDLADTLAKVVDEDAVSIVTNSYGDTEGDETPDDVVANEQAFQQGALEGITFLFSSGDNGDEVANTGTRQADYPASDPYVTAVGGTSTGIAADGSVSLQTGWGTQKYTLSGDGASWTPAGFLYGSGGGFSGLFNRPDWQSKVVQAADAGRAVPDIAMDADPTTGMLVGETQQFPNGPAYGEYRIGGTSLASPLMAGFLALTEQSAGARQGFIDPKLYKVAKNRPQLFNDVAGPGPDAGNVRADYANSLDAKQGILYSVRTFNQDSSLAVGQGWDDVTGIGVPAPKFLTGFNAAG